jgi:ABC-type glycerol-3-phosphate transport system substrate-binding protein
MTTLRLAIGLACSALAACSPSPQGSPAPDASAQAESSGATAEAATPVDRVDYGNQHVQSPSQITWHNAANGHPSADAAYACVQNHQIAINVTPTFKAEKIGPCPGGVLDYYKYTWQE